MALVVAGRLNKQVGGELGISEITVKSHRGSVMRKMKATFLADLVNMAATLHLSSAPAKTKRLGEAAENSGPLNTKKSRQVHRGLMLGRA